MSVSLSSMDKTRYFAIEFEINVDSDWLKIICPCFAGPGKSDGLEFYVQFIELWTNYKLLTCGGWLPSTNVSKSVNAQHYRYTYEYLGRKHWIICMVNCRKVNLDIYIGKKILSISSQEEHFDSCMIGGPSRIWNF